MPCIYLRCLTFRGYITKNVLHVNPLEYSFVLNFIFAYVSLGGNVSTSTIRLRGYSIRVSNDTALPESSCYTDPGNVTLPTIIEKDCERTARYVWIYQNTSKSGETPMLEICEVQVFGMYTKTTTESIEKQYRDYYPNIHCFFNIGSGTAIS